MFVLRAPGRVALVKPLKVRHVKNTPENLSVMQLSCHSEWMAMEFRLDGGLMAMEFRSDGGLMAMESRPDGGLMGMESRSYGGREGPGCRVRSPKFPPGCGAPAICVDAVSERLSEAIPFSPANVPGAVDAFVSPDAGLAAVPLGILPRSPFGRGGRSPRRSPPTPARFCAFYLPWSLPLAGGGFRPPAVVVARC